MLLFLQNQVGSGLFGTGVETLGSVDDLSLSVDEDGFDSTLCCVTEAASLNGGGGGGGSAVVRARKDPDIVALRDNHVARAMPLLPDEAEESWLVKNLSLPEARGLAAITREFGVEYDVWGLLQRREFSLFSHHSHGLSLAHMLLHIGVLLEEDRVHMREHFDDFMLQAARNGDYSPAGWLQGLFFSLYQCGLAPQTRFLEHKSLVCRGKTRRGLRRYRHAHMDYYDHATRTGHEAKLIARTGHKPPPRRIRDFKKQIAKYSAWLQKSGSHQFTYDLLWHCQELYMHLVREQTPARFHDRVSINVYLLWDYERPFLEIPLAGADFRARAHEYYTSLSLIGCGVDPKRRQLLADELTNRSQELRYRKEALYYEHEATLSALDDLVEFLKIAQRTRMVGFVVPRIERMVAQWKLMAGEDLHPEEIEYQNTQMMKFLLKASHYVGSGQYRHLLSMMTVCHILLHETRGFDEGFETMGIFHRLV